MDKATFMKIKEQQRKKSDKVIHMMDFAEWCHSKDLVEINKDGTVSWKEDKVGKKVTNHTSNKINGPRDGRDDLSGDFPDHVKCMGNSKSSVWPFKLKACSKTCKPIAPVGK
tara:strand:- start:3543 stop:3878 length:336 start_codon:yes stop_codon:yes gene_type:complete